ncbi:hypothetical protein AG1IA_10367 [Rhizoctonia solani AG-1 IA]|uniref:Uncharacterized protein n=1 Tax=Thanatephorus cucumeris (strain AG1-IA) TaxID=983506 RepID=L8WFP0_THACA|nr:hypothetical protein AG1IA_10367 [Rhizoctonia solani AG-1 IA]
MLKPTVDALSMLSLWMLVFWFLADKQVCNFMTLLSSCFCATATIPIRHNNQQPLDITSEYMLCNPVNINALGVNQLP